MIAFVCFVSIVLLSLIIQWLSKQWVTATLVPTSLFLGIVLFSPVFSGFKLVAFTLGLPMVFCAAVLGCYIYETIINPDKSQENEPDNIQ